MAGWVAGWGNQWMTDGRLGRTHPGPTQCILPFHVPLWFSRQIMAPGRSLLSLACRRLHRVAPGAPFPLLPNHRPALRPQGTGAPWGSSPFTKHQASHVLPPGCLTHRDFRDTPNCVPQRAPGPPGPASAPGLPVCPQRPSETAEAPLPGGPGPGASGRVWRLWPLWAPSPGNV